MRRPIISPELVAPSSDIICLLDSELRITYCNQAWDRFASQNDGRKCQSADLIGRDMLDCVPEPLARFFRTAFDVVRTSGQPFEFDYECSSALVFRMFRMRILPVAGSAEFMVVHALRIERPHDRTAVPPDDARFRRKDGLVVMCCHCRRTRRAAEPNVWDWVPDYVAKPPGMVTTGICSACYLYFYPEIFVNRAAADL